MDRQRRHRQLQEPAIARAGRSKRAGRRRGAFTLVEMLAVIAIIGILVTIVIGVSGSIMRNKADARTKMWMKVIMQACDVYQQATGEYPSFPDDTLDTYKANNAALYVLLSGPDSWGANDVGGKKKARARKEVRGLPKDATRQIDSTWQYMDAYGQILWYHPSGGANDSPYLESSGSDLNFGSVTAPEKMKDNIRSDRL